MTGIDDERRQLLIEQLQSFFLEEFDEELSVFRAERLLEHVLETAAPQIYNQAIQDARAFFLRKLDDLDGEVYLQSDA